MPCLLVLFALFVPRIVVLVTWFFTDWFAGMFTSLLWPILGFLFLPLTLLWYSVVVNVYGGEWGALQIVVAIIAVVMDLGNPLLGSNRKK